MKKFFNISKIIFLFVAQFSSFSTHGAEQCGLVFAPQNLTIEMILADDNRPNLFELKRLRSNSSSEFLIKNSRVIFDDRVFRVFVDVAKELLQGWDGRPIVLLGRDSELIYDAIQYLFDASDTSRSIRSRVHLVNLSRPVIESSNYSQIRSYLETQAGLDLDRVLLGQQKALIFDTGNRGSIYLKIINLMLGQIKSNDPAWKEKILNILEGVDFLLLASEERSTLQATIENIKLMTEFNRAELVQIFDRDEGDLFFRQLALPKSENKRLIPKNLDNRYDWVVQNVEYQPHWEGRTLGLSESGRARKLPLENDPRVDKSQYVLRQLQFYQFLESSREVQEIVDVFRVKNGGSPRLAGGTKIREKSSPTKPSGGEPKNQIPKVDAKPVRIPEVSLVPAINPSPGQVIAIGASVSLQNQNFVVESELGSGKRGRVYKVREVISGNLSALKVAKYNDEETLDSFQREYPKQVAYEKAGIPHAKILKQEQFWILKELVEGQRADQWLESWNINQEPEGGQRMESLIQLFNQIAQQEIYIGDLNPTNLIWNGGRWVIIDSGNASFNISSKKAKKRFFEKNKERWERYFSTDATRESFVRNLKRGLLVKNEND